MKTSRPREGGKVRHSTAKQSRRARACRLSRDERDAIIEQAVWKLWLRLWARTCSECRRTFKTPNALRSHRRARHRPPPVPCATCWRTFPTRQGMLQHKRTGSCRREAVLIYRHKTMPSVVTGRPPQEW